MKALHPRDVPVSTWGTRAPTPDTSAVREDVWRFSQRAHRALVGGSLTWPQWQQVHQDLGSLIVEARSDQPRVVLLRILIDLVTDVLADGGLDPGTLQELRESCPLLTELVS